MTDYFKAKTWLITVIIFLLALSFSSIIVYYEFGFERNVKILNAGASDNISGFAWNSNIGWISFNSANCDIDNNGFIDTDAMVLGCGGDNATTPSFSYGVNIDASGNFSGYAWNPGVGWISFNRSDTGDPPGQYNKTGSVIANKATDSNEVRGWAKILSLGDDGWIKLKKFPADGGSDYGVFIDLVSAPTISDMVAPNWNYVQASASALRANLQFSYTSANAGGFNGWAWNGNDNGTGIGWVSFNCDHTNDGTLPPNNINTCLTSSYRVVNNFSGVAGISDRAYEIKVNTRNQVHDPTPTFDTGKCLDAGQCEGNGCDPNKCKIDTSCLTNGNYCQYPLTATENLNYGTAYYWWVKVWDSNDVASDWVQYDSSQDTPIEADDGNSKTFTTYKHEFPRPVASHFIIDPSRKEEVMFIATSSQRFFSSAPATSVYCADATCRWAWTVKSGSADIITPTASTTIIKFNHAGLNTIGLKVTDNTDTGAIPYYNEINIDIDVREKLPKWQEVKPE